MSGGDRKGGNDTLEDSLPGALASESLKETYRDSQVAANEFALALRVALQWCVDFDRQMSHLLRRNKRVACYADGQSHRPLSPLPRHEVDLNSPRLSGASSPGAGLEDVR
ncbi:hypothetical protein BASA60_003758 [Batrachochytrium salamandrivorans]|nr:hypothetical protein BASA60_003758 [Batrachochytrium salamandrivorans]